MSIQREDEISLTEVIEEARNGNAKMQSLLYKRFSCKMFSICLKYTNNRSDAEDILQEGFIKVFSNLDKYRGDGSFEGWLRTIIIRMAINYYRNIKLKRQICQIEEHTCIAYNEANVLDRLAEKEITGLIRKMPQGYRTVFVMYVVEGYSHREIADMIGCSEGNCKSQLFRSKVHLKKLLHKEGITEAAFTGARCN